jgi:hypothetical protein
MKRTLPLGLLALALALALTTAACGGGGSSAGALGNETPKQILTSAFAAAKKSGTVHFELVGKSASTSETITGDASSTDGREVISAGSVKIEALVVGGAAYIQGNAGGLEDEMGLAAATATTYAGQWISIAHTDAPYASLTKAVTLASTLSQLEPTGHLTLTSATTKASHAVIGVHGGLPGAAQKGTTGTAVLYVSTSEPTVPIVFQVVETSSGSEDHDTGTFTDWGKPLHLVAPTSTVAFSTLPAATPTG